MGTQKNNRHSTCRDSPLFNEQKGKTLPPQHTSTYTILHNHDVNRQTTAWFLLPLVLFCCFFLVRAAAAQPVVFWVSDPVQPDETVLAAGGNFGNAPSIELVALADSDPGTPTTSLQWPKGVQPVRPEPIQPSGESVKFIVPDTFSRGMYLFRIQNSQGEFSKINRINAPTVYWIQGDIGNGAASPGGRLDIFGRCIGPKQGTGTVLLMKKDAPATVLQLDIHHSSPWRVQAVLPRESAPGDWQVFVHNGYGGPWGWTPAGELVVRPKKQWPQTRYNVRDFGAQGRGDKQDIAHIRAAIKAAEGNGGGVVYFPRGRYRIEGTLEIPRYVTLAGEKRELVNLFWPDTDNPYILVQGSDHFSLQELTLYAGNHKAVIAGDIHKPTAGHVILQRLRVRANSYQGHLTPEQVFTRHKQAQRLSSGGPDTIRLGGPGITVTDCDLYGSGRSMFLFKARGAYVGNNILYNGRWGWYSFSGCDGLIFENNQVIGADLMSTGGGINCLGYCPYSKNIFFASNHFARLFGWDREAMTTDAGGAAYFGHIAASRNTQLTLAGQAQWKKRDWKGAGVFILDGKGLGQHREITQVSEDGKNITLSKPWTIPPDNTSRITITALQENYIFINNRFEDTGIALQYYGTSINFIAAGNTSTRAGGFYNSGRWYHGFQPSWYCQFFSNTITEGYGYRVRSQNRVESGNSLLGTIGAQGNKEPQPPLLAFCAIHRGNALLNNAQIRIQGHNRQWPAVKDVVVEGNTVRGATKPLSVDEGVQGLHVHGNDLD
jgi:hypothetical protein